jgi:hypothetical protein
MTPVESVEWLEKNMIPFYHLGEIKDTLSTSIAQAQAQ